MNRIRKILFCYFLTFFLAGGGMNTWYTCIYVETLQVHRPHVHWNIGLVEVSGQKLGCNWLPLLPPSLPLPSLWLVLHHCGSLGTMRGQVAADWSRPSAVRSATEMTPGAACLETHECLPEALATHLVDWHGLGPGHADSQGGRRPGLQAAHPTTGSLSPERLAPSSRFLLSTVQILFSS